MSLPKGFKHSEETKKNMSIAHLGKKASEKTLKKMRGRKHTAEMIKKMRASHTGIRHSRETIEKIRMIHIGKKHTEDTIAKMKKNRRDNPNAGMKGKKQTRESRKKMSEARMGKTGKKGNNWKGGHKKTKGYIYIYNAKHPYKNQQQYVLEHRLIYEKFLGRYLESQEVIHHINGIRDDNRLENLQYFINVGKHTSFHYKIKKYGQIDSTKY